MNEFGTARIKSGVRHATKLLPYLTLVSALGACGRPPGAQRATILPISAPPSSPAPVRLSSYLREDRELAARYIVHPKLSDVRLYVADSFTGEHAITFDRWSAFVRPSREIAITADIDTASLHVSPDFLSGYVRRSILEVDRFPRSTLEATLRPLDESTGRYVVEGMLDLHGVRRRIQFVGKLERVGEEFRFDTTFTLSRKAFDVRVPAPWNGIVDDDVRVVLSVVASPEHVNVEEIP